MALTRLMLPPNGFKFEEPEGRPFRICSIETEVDGAGHALAGDLYRNGLVCNPEVNSYGFKPESNHPHIAFLKYDGSVTGGELVFDKLDLTNPAHAAALLRAHERLRDLEKDGHIAYNPNCGGHMHMDAYGYGFWDLVRLMTVFGFCEEPIFRLAGAGKTYGHRTLYAGYDRANGGQGYADPIAKGPFNDAEAAWNVIRAQKRMSGLNTSIYMRNQCTGRCKGATKLVDEKKNAYGEVQRRAIWDMKACTCKKEKHTIEWRVWNSQGNPRILYAWIALMQAMHAFAWRPLGDSYVGHDPMPAFTWTWRSFRKLNEDEVRLAQDRVEWMFAELPMTAEEKDALRYAFMRTPYKVFGKEWMKAQAETPYKPPPYPNEYVKSFKRKLGVQPDGTPWGEDTGDGSMPAAEAAPNAPWDRFPAFIRMDDEVDLPEPDDRPIRWPDDIPWNGPHSVNYTPQQLGEIQHRRLMRHLRHERGVRMQMRGGGWYIHDGRRWLPGDALQER